MKHFRLAGLCATALVLLTACSSVKKDSGFVPLFDGKTMNGWDQTFKTGPGYSVKDGVMICPAKEHGNIYTDKEYSDFVLRLDFKLTPGGNNGIGIRCPDVKGSVAYVGSEIQILDDDAPQYAKLEPAQYCGSVYKVFPARRGALKKPGEWNSYEITVDGRRIKVVLNGQTIVDGDISKVTDPEILKGHPGLAREKGRIGLLSHNSYVEFRNIKIKELSHAK